MKFDEPYLNLWLAIWQRAIKDECRCAKLAVIKDLTQHDCKPSEIAGAINYIYPSIHRAVTRYVSTEYRRYPINQKRAYLYTTLSAKALVYLAQKKGENK